MGRAHLTAFGYSSAVAVAGTVLGCAAAAPTPESRAASRRQMLDEAGVGMSCEGSAELEDRPFVVSWDGTDLAEFEALARRDTVFVKYEGCNLSVVRSCKHPTAPGSFGAYGEPVFTSGSRQSIAIDSESALYAKLPLGVARFGGIVRSGQSLALDYAVIGISQNSRDTIYRQELAAVEGCSPATHFVRAYNLGAFSLETKQEGQTGAGVEVDRAGLGAQSNHSDHRVAHLGEVETCGDESRAQCRVPIRLVLSRISHGALPAAPPPVTAPTPRAATSDSFAEVQLDVNRIMGEADRKLRAGDPSACVTAMRTETRLQDLAAGDEDPHAPQYLALYASWLEQQSLCEAAAGNCARGHELNRQAILVQSRVNELDGRGAMSMAEQQKLIAIRAKSVDEACWAKRVSGEDWNKVFQLASGGIRWYQEDADGAAWSAVHAASTGTAAKWCKEELAKVESKQRQFWGRETALGHLASAQLELGAAYCEAPTGDCTSARRILDTAYAAAKAACTELGREDCGAPVDSAYATAKQRLPAICSAWSSYDSCMAAPKPNRQKCEEARQAALPAKPMRMRVEKTWGYPWGYPTD